MEVHTQFGAGDSNRTFFFFNIKISQVHFQEEIHEKSRQGQCAGQDAEEEDRWQGLSCGLCWGFCRKGMSRWKDCDWQTWIIMAGCQLQGSP